MCFFNWRDATMKRKLNNFLLLYIRLDWPSRIQCNKFEYFLTFLSLQNTITLYFPYTSGLQNVWISWKYQNQANLLTPSPFVYGFCQNSLFVTTCNVLTCPETPLGRTDWRLRFPPAIDASGWCDWGSYTIYGSINRSRPT